MSQTPDKLREPIADLPNPELNPLLNPVLGRHLGQWAHVYFTTAPEKREEALFELIDDLKAEEARNGGPEAAEKAGATAASTSDGIYAIVCPQCERSNLRSQKFCGMCGALMPVRAQAAAASGGGTTFGSAMFEQNYATAHEPADAAIDLERTEPLNRIREDTEAEPESPFAATSLLFQSSAGDTLHRPFARSEQAMPEARSEPVDIEWLRKKNFPSQADSSSGIRNYLLGIAIVICIGILVFLLAIRPHSSGQVVAKQKPPMNWNPGQNAPTPMPTVESSDNGTAAATPSPNDNVPQADIPMENAKPRVAQPEPSRVSAPNSAAAQSNQKPARRNKSPESSQPVTAESDQNNGIEVAMAKQYLSGSNGQPDGAAAAEILWKAVGKGNAAALLMLSDLYATGNGVAKNCDQARLLLQAAQRRNAPAADAKLQQLQKACP